MNSKHDHNRPADPGAGRQNSSDESGPEPEKRMKSRHVIGSVFAAGLGVQSSKNRERDFTEGSAGTFIIAGVIFTALFIGGVYLIVQIVLKSAT